MNTNFKAAKKSKVRATVKNILFSFFIFLIFILLLEIIFRTTHLFGARVTWVEPNPIFGWQHIPNSKYWYYKENDHPITGRINSYGWRDKEWSLQKPPGAYRIAVLGDSFVEAFQVESNRTFLALAEYQLNQEHSLKVELMNFGRAGATQSEELLILRNRVAKFSPDMVLLFFTPGNDIDEVRRETAGNLLRPFFNISKRGELILDTSFSETGAFKIKSFIKPFKQHSALISLICERYRAYQLAKQSKNKTKSKTNGRGNLPKKIKGYLSLCTDNPELKYLKSYQLNKILIKAMSEYCKEKGMRFMLVCIDIIVYIPENEKKYKEIDSTFNANFFEDDLEDYAKLLNIECLGLQRIFRRSYERNSVDLHWGHWNYHGHKVVGESLTHKLVSIIGQNKKRME